MEGTTTMEVNSKKDAFDVLSYGTRKLKAGSPVFLLADLSPYCFLELFVDEDKKCYSELGFKRFVTSNFYYLRKSHLSSMGLTPWQICVQLDNKILCRLTQK